MTPRCSGCNFKIKCSRTGFQDLRDNYLVGFVFFQLLGNALEAFEQSPIYGNLHNDGHEQISR